MSVPSRVDDGTVADDERLWRILRHPTWVKREPDGTLRCSSVAFKDGYTNEVSVDRADLVPSSRQAQIRADGHGLAELRARVPRSLRHLVVPDPLPENPAHALIVPPATASRSQVARDADKIARQVTLLEVPESASTAQ